MNLAAVILASVGVALAVTGITAFAVLVIGVQVAEHRRRLPRLRGRLRTLGPRRSRPPARTHRRVNYQTPQPLSPALRNWDRRSSWSSTIIPCMRSRLLSTRARLRGPTGGSVALYCEIRPLTTMRPWMLSWPMAASRWLPPTLSKLMSMPSPGVCEVLGAGRRNYALLAL